MRYEEDFDFENSFGDGLGSAAHHFDLVGVIGPDAEEFAGGEGELDPALALVAPEIVLRLAAEDRQRLGGGDLHALGTNQHDVDVQEFLVGLEEALLVGDGVVGELGTPDLAGDDVHALVAQGGEEFVADALQSQIQVGMDPQVVPGGIVFR